MSKQIDSVQDGIGAVLIREVNYPQLREWHLRFDSLIIPEMS